MVCAAEVERSAIPPAPMVRVLVPRPPLLMVTLAESAVEPEPVKFRLLMLKFWSSVVVRFVAVLAVKNTFVTAPAPPGI